MIWLPAPEVEVPLYVSDTERLCKNLLSKLDSEKIFSEEDIEHVFEIVKNERYYGDNSSAIELGKSIKRIRIVEMAPQELLPKKDRNIKSKRTFYHEKKLFSRIVENTDGRNVLEEMIIKLKNRLSNESTRANALDELFMGVFAKNSPEKEKFIKRMETSRAQEIVIVDAHGGYSNFIGEQSTKVAKTGHGEENQHPGNIIDIQQIIDRYSDPEKYSAILIHTCYLGKEKLPVSKVPVFRLKGISGVAAIAPVTSVEMSLPIS